MILLFSSKVSFAGSNSFSFYLLDKSVIGYEGRISCKTSVIVHNFFDQFVESPLLKTFLISVVLTNCPSLNLAYFFLSYL